MFSGGLQPAQAQVVKHVPTIPWQNVDWGNASLVRPADGQMRYVIPVEIEGGGESFDITEDPNKGGWTLPQGVGMTFNNPVDGSTQGIQGDGSGVLIVNGVNPFHATQIQEVISGMGGLRSIRTIDQYRDLIGKIGTRAGKPDIYNSDLDWVDKNTVQNPSQLDSALTFAHNDRHFGFLPKTGEFSLAYYVTGETGFIGSRGQDHSLIAPVGVLVKGAGMIKVDADGNPDPEGEHEIPDIYASQIAPFVGAYVLADGTKITYESLSESIARLEYSVESAEDKHLTHLV